MNNTKKEIQQYLLSKEENFSKPVKRRKQQSKKRFPSHLEEFATYLEKSGYSEAGLLIRKRRVMMFFRELEKISNLKINCLEDCKGITETCLKKYETHLEYRYSLKEISARTVYGYISYVKLFLDYLYMRNIINFEYIIPRKFIVPPTRSNDFVDAKSIMTLFDSVLNRKSEIKYRNIAILLIILDTGCRPVEISSIKLNDLNLTEKTIIVYSFKSGQRKLTLTDGKIIPYLKMYLQIRKDFDSTSDYLFLNETGEGITSSSITNMIFKENLKAFGKGKVNAKALRHTYTTNAVENKNDLKEISAALGHKHLVSTMHYLHRSKQRLISNTLPYDPLIAALKEDNNAD
ncbi:tyrosine-type recombinase/integrase [Oceanobacillus kimchii]|uniref:tyrosine-type recombinase/integrase n=1 Tax=Oceanobacillus kimchii TaxID=746691 RepID=UPI003C77D18B